MILKIISTTLTGIGGHYLNRRWDKAVLFLVLFFLYTVFSWVGVRIYLMSRITAASSSSDKMMAQLTHIDRTVAIVYLSGIVILWVISILLTIIDGKKENPVESFQWTTTGRFAAALTTLLSFCLLVFPVISSLEAFGLNETGITLGENSQEVAYSGSTSNFYQYILLGNVPSEASELPAPPEGGGRLQGRISYQGHPVEGVRLNMVLNAKYQAKNIISNAEGVFMVNLPPGEWRINSIQTRAWPGKPEKGEFSIFYGGEPRLSGSRYNRHHRLQSQGLLVTVEKNTNTPQLNLTIKKNIELVGPDAEAAITDAIQWRPYPGAEKYQVQIMDVRREGTTTYYTPVTAKTVKGGTRLPLSGLQHITAPKKKKHEYTVEIFAFAKDGTLIGQNSGFGHNTFLLTDGHLLVEDDLQDLFPADSNEDSQSVQDRMERVTRDRQRLRAVEILIDENMLAEAESLLERVKAEYTGGRKDVLSGYILALRGNCAAAERMFDRARELYPEVCVPDSYRTICE